MFLSRFYNRPRASAAETVAKLLMTAAPLLALLALLLVHRWVSA